MDQASIELEQLQRRNKQLHNSLEEANKNKFEAKEAAHMCKKLRDIRRVELAQRIVEITKKRGIPSAQLIENMSSFVGEKNMEFLRSAEMAELIESLKTTPEEVPQNGGGNSGKDEDYARAGSSK